jgi:hypothetical protein
VRKLVCVIEHQVSGRKNITPLKLKSADPNTVNILQENVGSFAHFDFGLIHWTCSVLHFGPLLP